MLNEGTLNLTSSISFSLIYLVILNRLSLINITLIPSSGSFKKGINFTVPIDVVYNVVESDKIIASSNETVGDTNFNKDKINIISVGKLMKVKGYDRLVNVTKKLIDEGYPIHVYIVGKGEERASLERQISALNIGDNWTFVGFTSNPYKYVKNADLYVCSSYSEGFSTAVTESLIVGTPVVSTNCSGAYELLGYNNEYGIVTENSEEGIYLGIKKMLEGDNLSFYKQQAVERGKEFNTEKTTEIAEKTIEGVLN